MRDDITAPSGSPAFDFKALRLGRPVFAKALRLGRLTDTNNICVEFYF
jgi:hypothetical protein